MAKKDLFEEAQKAGHVPEEARPEHYTAVELETLLGRGAPAWEGSLSASKPVVSPDGHVALSQEDIDARDT